jgi:hypothetical protein
VRRGCTNCGFERLREFSGEVSKKLLNLREPPKSNQIKSLQIWNPDLLQHNRKRSLCGGTAKKSLVGGWFGMGPKPNFPLSSRRATSPPPTPSSPCPISHFVSIAQVLFTAQRNEKSLQKALSRIKQRYRGRQWHSTFRN